MRQTYMQIDHKSLYLQYCGWLLEGKKNLNWVILNYLLLQLHNQQRSTSGSTSGPSFCYWRAHHSTVATATPQGCTWPQAHSSFLAALPLKALLMTEAQRNLHPGDLSTTNVASYDSKLLLWMNNNFIPAGCVRVRVCTPLRMCALKHHWLVAGAAWSRDQGPLITVRSAKRTSLLGNNGISLTFSVLLTGRPSWGVTHKVTELENTHPEVTGGGGGRGRQPCQTIFDSLNRCF